MSAATVTKLEPSSSRFSLDFAKQRAAEKPKPRILLYGEPGAGKTTFGCSAPAPVLIPTEDGALAVNVPKLPHDGKCRTWQDVLDAADALLSAEHDREWVVVDTLNGAAQLCAEFVCQRDFNGKWEAAKGQDGYNAFGRGEMATAQEFRALLTRLDALQQKKGLGIVCLAHTSVVRQSNAMGADFHKLAPDFGKNVRALVTAWADQVGYAGYELRASTRDGETKAKASRISEARYVWFEGEPGRDAKNRVGYEMPSRINLDWAEYFKHLNEDPIGPLVTEMLGLIASAKEETAALIKERIETLTGEPLTAESARKLGKQKLEATISWLLGQ